MSTATLDFLLNKFNLGFDDETPMPLEVPDFGRKQLAELLHELDFKTAVEVGVAEGRYSSNLLEANPQMKLYGVDPYVPYKGYRDYVRQTTLDSMYNKAEKLLNHYHGYKFVKKFSMDALKDFADKSLDFVYLDGNHEEPFISQDIGAWNKKLKSGGILAGHDYFKSRHHTQIQVVQAVRAYTDTHKVVPWFVLGNGANNEGLIRDMPRSWMWVKA